MSPAWKTLNNKRIDKKLGCYFCGTREPYRPRASSVLVIHHIDTDRSNNDLSNLMLLCRQCHKRLHNKIYKQLTK